MTDIDLIAPPEPFAAIIFDCDGTLADTMPTHFDAWLTALRSFGDGRPKIDVAVMPILATMYS